MKSLIAICMLVLISTTVYLVVADRSQKAYTSDNLIRFHVIANSDSAADQHLKMLIRDRIIEATGNEFAKAKDLTAAENIAQNNLEKMRLIAAREIKTAGKDYPVRTEIGYFSFPTKSYGNYTLPAGNYQAVRVVIGEGKGANWWCVLFPPLCFVDISNYVTEDLAPREVMATTGASGATAVPKVEVRLKFLEVLGTSRHYLAETIKL